MQTKTIPPVKKRGRPRSQRAEQAILKAANELLAESGLAAMTIEEVAARAGVGKASIYRRWSSKASLAFDAFVDQFLAGQPIRDTGSLRGDLLAFVRDWIRTVKRTPSGRALSGLIAAVQSDPELAAAWRERFISRVRKQRRQVVERAIVRGEIPAGSDPDLLLDLLYGALYHRYLHIQSPLTDRFAQGVASMIAAGAAAGAAVPRRPPSAAA